MHRYTAQVAWSGSTALGYDGYDRRHAATTEAGFTLPLSADAAFRGDPACPNPEELLVMAAASCHLLSFLAVAARARIDVLDYRDAAHGEMPDSGEGGLSAIRLRPQITVASPADRPLTVERVLHLNEVAHRECYIASSLRTPIDVSPTVTICPIGGVAVSDVKSA